MKTEQPVAIKREEYKPSPYRVSKTELEFHLEPTATRVFATLHFERQSEAQEPVVLNGEHLKLIDIQLDGRPLAKDAYELTEDKLIIKNPPPVRFRLDTTVEINPHANVALSGL